MNRYDTDETDFATVAEQLNFLSCQPDTTRTTAILRAVIRGERPLSDLVALGITDAASRAASCAGLPVWSADLAEGIVNLKGDNAVLCEWARFVLSAADLFDYASADVPCSQRLLSYIGKILYGTGLPPRAITLATMVRYWPRRAA